MRFLLQTALGFETSGDPAKGPMQDLFGLSNQTYTGHASVSGALAAGGAAGTKFG
jgi:hypothetical protein